MNTHEHSPEGEPEAIAPTGIQIENPSEVEISAEVSAEVSAEGTAESPAEAASESEGRAPSDSQAPAQALDATLGASGAHGDAQSVATEDDQLDGQPVELPAEQPDAPVEQDIFAGVPAGLVGALRRRGFDGLTAVQSAVLATDVKGRDLSISSQTGSGKTVALGFVLTETLAEPRADDVVGPDVLIIVPTRELAQQVREELDWLFADLDGVRATVVTGGTPVYPDRQRLRRGDRVLVGTPGRLLDHVESRALDLSAVRELVLDEADQMLDMGFRDELEGILEATPSTRRTHMVSATFPDAIRRLADRYQSDVVSVEGTRLGEANADIEHVAHLVRGHDRYDALVNLLLLAGDDRTLVFVERRADALELAQQLEGDGFSALPLSGELAQSQRERTLAAFRDGRARVLVATDVAARGLDVPEVEMVVQMAPPIDGQIYTHRSGRTGRAGRSGRSVLFCHPSRKRKVARILGDADVELRFAAVPDADEVERLLAERDRAALVARIESALESEPDERRLAAARELIERHDAESVVAALLAKLDPSDRARPRSIEVLEPRGGERRERGERPQRRDDRRDDGRDQRRGRSFDSRDFDRSGGGRPDNRGPRSDAPRSEAPRRNDAPRVGDFGARRFFMNYGANQGASPGRVLALVCRRGEVAGSDIGSIAIHPNATTFDVNADVADRFEDLAARRDPRDPRVLIRRDRGPRPGGSGGGQSRNGQSRGGQGGGYGGERRPHHAGGAQRGRDGDRGGARGGYGAGRPGGGGGYRGRDDRGRDDRGRGYGGPGHGGHGGGHGGGRGRNTERDSGFSDRGPRDPGPARRGHGGGYGGGERRAGSGSRSYGHSRDERR